MGIGHFAKVGRLGDCAHLSGDGSSSPHGGSDGVARLWLVTVHQLLLQCTGCVQLGLTAECSRNVKSWISVYRK
jgi:hypothetical protein